VAPGLIYNLALLTVLTLNGIFAYRLVRAIDADSFPALLGGVLTVTLPFVAKVVGVLPNMALFGILWTLEGLVRFGQNRSMGWAVWAVVGFAATYLSMQQYALFFLPFAGTAGLISLAQLRFHRKAVVRLGLAGLIAGLLVLLVALPGISVRAELGFYRPERLVQALSAGPDDWLTRPATALVTVPSASLTDTGGLFPGIMMLALAVAGTIIGVRDRKQRLWIAYFAGSALITLWLACGLNVNIAGWRPFAALRALVPGMTEVRSPFRYAALTQLCLAILVVPALTWIRHVIIYKGSAVISILGLLAAAENLAIPVPLLPVPSQVETPWTHWLRAQPDPTVIAHIPFPTGLHVSDYEIETWRMVAQIDHRKPMVNGYSSYLPQSITPEGRVVPTYAQFQLTMAREFPSTRLLCVLSRSLGVNLLVVDQPWLATHRTHMTAHHAFLRSAYADEQVQIYYVSVPAEACNLR
jgi:hypothetical protein